MFSREKVRVNIIENARLVLDDSDHDGLSVEVKGGTNQVITIIKTNPGRLNTYDTGSIEYVYLEVDPDQMKFNDNGSLTSWVSGYYLKGGMRLLFVSNVLTGQLNLQRRLRKTIFLKPYHEYKGDLCLACIKPLLDVNNYEEINIQWPIKFNASS